MTRFVFIALLSVLATVLLATVSLPIAMGQDVGPLFPPIQVPSGQVSPEPTVIAPTPVLTPRVTGPIISADPAHHAANSVNEEHWLISIRNCQQNCRQCAHCCRLDYFRADWDCPTRISQPEFVRGLHPGVPVCIVVHGSYVTRESVTEDCQRTFEWLRQAAPHRPLHVVFFTWPSEGIFTLEPSVAVTSPVPGVDVAILGRRAEINGVRLAQLVNLVPSENPVCLIGHSHGARMVASALHLLGGGQLPGLAMRPGPPHRIRTVLAGAAIDHDWLRPDERFGKVLCTTESLLNLKSRKDWALWFYPFRKPFSPAALGRKGFTDKDLRKLGEHAAQVSELDVTDEVGVGHIWPNYYDRPEIARAIAPLVYFEE